MDLVLRVVCWFGVCLKGIIVDWNSLSVESVIPASSSHAEFNLLNLTNDEPGPPHRLSLRPLCLCAPYPQHPSPLTFVVTLHTLSTPEIPALRSENSISCTPQRILAVLIAVRRTVSPINSIPLHLETAERVHVAVAGTGGLVGGFDVAVGAVGARVDGYTCEA